MSGNNRNAAESLSDDLYEFCASENLSEEGIHKIIERHRVTPNAHPNVGNYDFFIAACRNESFDEGIIRYLLEYFPTAVNAANENGSSPLHLACYNKNVSLNIIQLLIDAAPDSVRRVNTFGNMPLHTICVNPDYENEEAAIEILMLLLEKFPESIRRAGIDGYLPLHWAARKRSPEFCRVLIEAYPRSERISNEEGALPLHCACAFGNLVTVEYLYNLHPDAIYHASVYGHYPIHCAIHGHYPIHRAIQGMLQYRITAVEVVQFLLDCDPNVKLQKFDGMSLLHLACRLDYDDSNIDAALQVTEAIYDAHPEAIEEDRITSDIQRCHQQVQTFINGELVYARQARDHHQMMNPDENGQLPLHRALQNNVRLGSIKLLVKGNPSATRFADTGGALPLHLACQHHDAPSVVEYLIDLYPAALNAAARDGNTALHYACRCAKYGTIAMLIERYDAVSVSKLNTLKKLPIDLLWESNEVTARDSVEYLDTVFRLLKAYPETLMIEMQMKQQAKSANCSSDNEKKRKFDVV